MPIPHVELDVFVVMNACDPANLYGPSRGDEQDGGVPSFSRVPSTWLVQQHGLPVIVARDGGAHITVAQATGERQAQRAVLSLLDHLAGFEHRVTVETWNGEPVLDSSGRAVLEAAGFYRSYPAMVWDG